jgi:hypothetical protein
VNPAQALSRIFGDARIDVYADGAHELRSDSDNAARDGRRQDRAVAAS